MNPVRQAIYDVLAADAELVDLASSGIFYREAPEGTEPPLLIFQKQVGTRMWTFGGTPLHEEVWLVKGVSDFADDAEAIDERAQTVLTDVQLVIADRELRMAPLPDDDVAYGEETSGEHYEHVGTNYRVVTERTS